MSLEGWNALAIAMDERARAADPTEPPASDGTVSRRHGQRLPKKLWVGLGIVGVLTLVAILAPLLAPFDPNDQDLRTRLASPSSAHLLGTDAVGRDTLSRLIYAARVDLPVTFVAVAIPAVTGVILGCIVAFRGGLPDTAVMRLADVSRAFPVYVLVLALIAVLGPGAGSFIVACALVGWVAYARIARVEVLRVRSLEYIAAARSGGLGSGRILVRHVLPNVIAQPIVFLMSDLVYVLLALSALSFLGLGIQAPTAEWGRMIVEGQPYIRTHAWLIFPPGALIVVLGIGLSLIGDGLDDRLRTRA
jgi:peptide/nickel transport system permease protein